MSANTIGRVLWLWSPPVAEMAAIFFLSSRAAPPIAAAVSDKVIHGVIYGILALLILRAAASGRWRGVSVGTVGVAVALTGLYGMIDEWHQSFVPSRTAEWADVVADVCGGSLAAGAAWTWDIITHARDRSA